MSVSEPDSKGVKNLTSLRREFHQGYARLEDSVNLTIVCDLCRRRVWRGAFIYAFPVGPLEPEVYHSDCFQAAYFGES